MEAGNVEELLHTTDFVGQVRILSIDIDGNHYDSCPTNTTEMFGNLIARFHGAPTLPESVYFYTLHKCASGLFSDYVLKNARGLRLIDYADQFYNGVPSDLVFEE